MVLLYRRFRHDQIYLQNQMVQFSNGQEPNKFGSVEASANN